MAKVGTILANGGVGSNGVRVMSAETVEKMHANPKMAKDYTLGKMHTKFTQGGMNLYEYKRLN